MVGPVGTTENSPALQRRVSPLGMNQSRQGRLKTDGNAATQSCLRHSEIAASRIPASKLAGYLRWSLRDRSSFAPTMSTEPAYFLPGLRAGNPTDSWIVRRNSTSFASGLLKSRLFVSSFHCLLAALSYIGAMFIRILQIGWWATTGWTDLAYLHTYARAGDAQATTPPLCISLEGGD